MSKIFTVIILVILVVIILGILLTPKSMKKDLNIQDTDYIEIRYHNKTYKISNSDIINELVKKFSNLEIKEYHPYISKLKDMQFSSSKSSYKLSYYESNNRNNKLCEIEVISDSIVKINNCTYKVVSDDNIYTLTRKITEYCIVPLPELTVNSIYQYSTSDNFNMTKDEIYEMYCKVLDCKPITQEKFKTSQEYINFNTYDDEKIDIYIIINEVYIKYMKGRTTCYFVYNESE